MDDVGSVVGSWSSRDNGAIVAAATIGYAGAGAGAASEAQTKSQEGGLGVGSGSSRSRGAIDAAATVGDGGARTGAPCKTQATSQEVSTGEKGLSGLTDSPMRTRNSRDSPDFEARPTEEIKSKDAGAAVKGVPGAHCSGDPDQGKAIQNCADDEGRKRGKRPCSSLWEYNTRDAKKREAVEDADQLADGDDSDAGLKLTARVWAATANIPDASASARKEGEAVQGGQG
ncbi:hypothetical protein M758_UG297800 [Ceratodon purpureus]|nr:hypothetical protein M758_UG297800 [Ceratodon purpureus]